MEHFLVINCSNELSLYIFVEQGTWLNKMMTRPPNSKTFRK